MRVNVEMNDKDVARNKVSPIPSSNRLGKSPTASPRKQKEKVEDDLRFRSIAGYKALTKGDM